MLIGTPGFSDHFSIISTAFLTFFLPLFLHQLRSFFEIYTETIEKNYIDSQEQKEIPVTFKERNQSYT